LLRFADIKPLGERGWFWLRIHCANLFGKDKLTFADRINWVDHNMNAILAVGKDPLGSESVRFVSAQTDDYWQTVAACIEIKDAVASGDPTTFESGLPVQQDGSCNGLQHYAALGRDELGALAVNVKPSNRVEDVYTVVLDIVRDRVKSDAEKFKDLMEMETSELFKLCPATFDKLKTGDIDRQRAILANIAVRSEGVLARKTVKQTVMTICYGVTQIGASDQVAKQLNELPLVKHLSAAEIAVLSSYLARLTLSSIDTVFSKAMEIKRWFDKVSAEVNKHKLPVSWISPAGVPCRQPYRKQALTSIRTPMQKITLSNEINYDNAPISAAKQRMGFPPNFIHSLDASHMILTALECKKAGISFASVHDSFWTHAADVDTMNHAIRQEFHKMYDKPILKRLRDSLVFSLGVDGNKIPPLPQQGDLNLKCVLDSPYFFD
jgi:DNA-directed RNA polymerase